MVTTIGNKRTDSAIVKRPALVVELIGPAGAGKTTLSQALSRCQNSISARNIPSYRSIRESLIFARGGFLLVPTLVRLFMNRNNDRFLTWREIVWIAILNGWHHFLRTEVANGGKVVVLDQGPVFLLAQLHMFGPKSLRSQSAKEWWERVVALWAATLDMLVYLDTSDDYLLNRIRTRGKWHLVKDNSALEAFEFLGKYREVYEQVTSMLTANQRSPRLLRFDTGLQSPDEIVNRLMVELGLKEDEGKRIYYLTTEATCCQS